MKKQTRLAIIMFIVAVVAIGGYFYVSKNKNISDSRTQYTNQQYNYSVNITPGLKIREGNDASGNLFVYDPNMKSENGLTVNIYPPDGSTTTPNSTTKIDGQTAEIYTFTDEHNLNRKSYQILYNGMIYEITFAPLNDPRFETIAQSFKFTK